MLALGICIPANAVGKQWRKAERTREPGQVFFLSLFFLFLSAVWAFDFGL